MRDGLLPVEEEGVRSPDVTGQEVVQGQHLHGAFEAKPLVFPALAEEHVDRVFLQGNNNTTNTLEKTGRRTRTRGVTTVSTY